MYIYPSCLCLLIMKHSPVEARRGASAKYFDASLPPSPSSCLPLASPTQLPTLFIDLLAQTMTTQTWQLDSKLSGTV